MAVGPGMVGTLVASVGPWDRMISKGEWWLGAASAGKGAGDAGTT